MTSSAPVNPADLDTVFLVPCTRCGEMLQQTARFCPLCGKDQFPAQGSGGSWLDADDAWLNVEPEKVAAGASEAPAPAAMDFAAMPHHQEAQALMGHPVPGGPAREAANSEFGRVRPSDFRQKEGLEGEGPTRWPGSAVARSRLVIGIMAAVIVLLVAVLVHDNFYLEKPTEPGKVRAFSANVEQVQRALSHGDLNAAARALDVLGAEYPDEPGVQQLRDAYDRQVLEAAGVQKPRADADPKASRPPDAGEPAARSAQGPVSPQAPSAAVPAPAAGAADPKATECNDVLAALALCLKR